MRPSFDIEALRTIVVANKLGSFARAAVQLGRSQSTVSMQLKRLEEQVDRPLFERSGRTLLPTEAGEVMLAYARRIIDIYDEAGKALGALPTLLPTIRLGLPQDFFDDVMPDALATFSTLRSHVHIEVRADRNFVLEEEINAGRLDIAIVFSPAGGRQAGELLASMPMFWFVGRDAPSVMPSGGLPLVLLHHPCLFRNAALQSLDDVSIPWRLALTAPSLSAIWAALRFGVGITVRTAHSVPAGVRRFDDHLPPLPELELRMLTARDLSDVALEFVDVLKLSFNKSICHDGNKGRA
jgi:DNA-binding transcriptional LysR family regulator